MDERIRQLAEDMAASGYARSLDEAVEILNDTISGMDAPLRMQAVLLPSRWHPIRRWRVRRAIREEVNATQTQPDRDPHRERATTPGGADRCDPREPPYSL